MRLRRHKTIASVLRAFDGPEAYAERLRDLGEDDQSEAQIHAGIHGMGYWGFVTVTTAVPVIHYWTDGRRTIAQLVRFFGHELGHVTGAPARGMLREEERADLYGHVACLALDLARKVPRG